jgi:hypothetical protein
MKKQIRNKVKTQIDLIAKTTPILKKKDQIKNLQNPSQIA